MLEFKPLKLEDIPLVRPFLPKSSSRICDLSVGGIFMWRSFFNASFAIESGTLFFQYATGLDKNIPVFSIPLGGNVVTGLFRIRNHCRENSIPMRFCTVSSSDLAMLADLFPLKKVIAERDWFDYLYRASDLVNFPGGKYGGQRNHKHRFQKLYPQAVFERVRQENIPEIIDFIERFHAGRTQQDKIETEEKNRTIELFENYELYGMRGEILRVGKEIAAVAAGEIVNDTLFVHIEKADTSFEGVYSAVCSGFAAGNTPDGVEYINREEDVGDPGLRKSKLSYHPFMILKKYTVEAE